MRKLYKILSSRSFFFALLALVQISLFFWLAWRFTTIGPYTYAFMIMAAALVVVFLLNRDDVDPSYKVMWLLVTVILPVPGALMYLTWGDRKLPAKVARRFSLVEYQAAQAMRSDEQLFSVLEKAAPQLSRQAEYLGRMAAAPVYQQTDCTYFSCGEEFFPFFLKRLSEAQECIFLEYFIIEQGEMWDKTLEILAERASAGVDVRVIWDGFGSLFTLPENYEQKLARMGIKARIFNPLALSPHISDYIMLNHRDHRKICVVDGDVGFTGGLNFADEYINRKKRFGYWKDTAFCIQGPAVYSLTVTFLKMWHYLSGQVPDYNAYLPKSRGVTDGFVQPFADTPLDDENVSESAYMNIINRAKDYVYLTTPYLVLDYQLQTALTLAAKSGVDVRIVVPGIPDKPYVYLLTRSYYRPLLQAGVKIYEYTPGFIHAKMHVSDDKVAVVGSANLDFRSLYLHFENCCAFYGGQIVQDVRRDVENCFAQSRLVTMADVNATPRYRRILQMIFRFFAPLM